jgi:hypothetical protein
MRIQFLPTLMAIALCFFTVDGYGFDEGIRMRLLQLGELRQLMIDPMVKITLSSHEAETAEKAAITALPLVGLTDVSSKDLRLEVAYRSANEHTILVHYNYGVSNTYLIVVLDQDRYLGHILFDIGAEYKQAILSGPHLSQSQEPTKVLIESVVKALPNQKDPYVILETGTGTYMQALWTKKGFILEYQMVTTACHYEASSLVTQDQVIAALNSYAFGTYEWTKNFSWRLLKL